LFGNNKTTLVKDYYYPRYDAVTLQLMLCPRNFVGAGNEKSYADELRGSDIKAMPTTIVGFSQRIIIGAVHRTAPIMQ